MSFSTQFPNYPFVGRDFNATSAGVHVDGLAKNEEFTIFLIPEPCSGALCQSLLPTRQAGQAWPTG